MLNKKSCAARSAAARSARQRACAGTHSSAVEDDQEQVQPVDARASSGCRARGSSRRRSRTACRRRRGRSRPAARSRRRAPRRVPADHDPARRPARAGTRRAAPAASGRKIRIERWIVTVSSTDQEVEDEAAPRRSAAAARRRAGSRSGSRARTMVPARTTPAVPPTMHALHERALDDGAAEAADGRDRPHEGGVVELVEVPLVHEEVVQRAEALAQPQRGRRAGARRAKNATRDAGEREQRRPRRARPLRRRSTVPCRRSSSPRTSARGSARACRSRRGWPTTPPMIARTASGAIAAFIGHSRSAMWCSGPGKPTSVSSALAGRRVAGSPWARWPRLELARLRDGLAEEDAEHHPERVERGQQRGRRSRSRRARCSQPPRFSVNGEDLVLREEAGREREAGQRERADRERRRT